jgi:hypothetical protein
MQKIVKTLSGTRKINITEETIKAAAKAIYDAMHKGLTNCYLWDDPGLIASIRICATTSENEPAPLYPRHQKPRESEMDKMPANCLFPEEWKETWKNHLLNK